MNLVLGLLGLKSVALDFVFSCVAVCSRHWISESGVSTTGPSRLEIIDWSSRIRPEDCPHSFWKSLDGSAWTTPIVKG